MRTPSGRAHRHRPSLKVHGFKNIIFIGDSGGNQAGQPAVAEKLTEQWKAPGRRPRPRVLHDAARGAERDARSGVIRKAPSDNLHDDPIITLNMFIDRPQLGPLRRARQDRQGAINGVAISEKKKSTELAKKVVEFPRNIAAPISSRSRLRTRGRCRRQRRPAVSRARASRSQVRSFAAAGNGRCATTYERGRSAAL